MENDKKFSLFEAAAWFMRNVSLLKSEEYILGCGSTQVVGEGSALIHVQSTVAFQPHRIIIPSNMAICFLLTGFDIDGNNQLISTGAIPGEAFIPQVDTHLKCDPVPKNGWINLSVTNLSSNPFFFSAAVIGRAL